MKEKKFIQPKLIDTTAVLIYNYIFNTYKNVLNYQFDICPFKGTGSGGENCFNETTSLKVPHFDVKTIFYNLDLEYLAMSAVFFGECCSQTQLLSRC